MRNENDNYDKKGPVPNVTLSTCCLSTSLHFHGITLLWLLGRSLLRSSLQCSSAKLCIKDAYRTQRGCSQTPFWNLKWQKGHPMAIASPQDHKCIWSVTFGTGPKKKERTLQKAQYWHFCCTKQLVSASDGTANSLFTYKNGKNCHFQLVYYCNINYFR